MLLRSKRSLGVLPEIMVFMTFFVVLALLLIVTFWINRRDPLILVPEAMGASSIRPATVDDEYIRAFVDNFYGYWGSWNEHTYLYRRSQAIDLMTPGVRPAFREMAAKSGELALTLSQSQSLALSTFRIEHVSPIVTKVTVEGSIKTYYGGVGGDLAEPYQGTIGLVEVTPSKDNPFCLEVIGLTTTRASESSP